MYLPPNASQKIISRSSEYDNYNDNEHKYEHG